MRLLLDTHVLLWFVDQDQLLSKKSHAAITDPTNDIFISAATIWELSIKVGSGKLKISSPYREWITRAIHALDGTLLPITIDYAECQSTLPKHHSDPFDRLLISQALVEHIPLVSNDSEFDQYGITRIW